VIWALLDVTTIVVLISGLVLWATRRRGVQSDADDLLRAIATMP